MFGRMKRASILAVTIALSLAGVSAPALADIAGPDPACEGKEAGDACTLGKEEGACVSSFGDLVCDTSAEPDDGCAVHAGRGRTGGLVAFALVAAGVAALRGRKKRG